MNTDLDKYEALAFAYADAKIAGKNTNSIKTQLQQIKLPITEEFKKGYKKDRLKVAGAVLRAVSGFGMSVSTDVQGNSISAIRGNGSAIIASTTAARRRAPHQFGVSGALSTVSTVNAGNTGSVAGSGNGRNAVSANEEEEVNKNKKIIGIVTLPLNSSKNGAIVGKTSLSVTNEDNTRIVLDKANKAKTKKINIEKQFPKGNDKIQVVEKVKFNYGKNKKQ